ncbi:MAG: Type secretion system domain, type pilus assembly protein PilC [Candidatus Kaiserbacteria bacterium]|nr:Type secretion system domain, type pilus assembly protein PilC [Candidatus Kaiserbacteria bacterium]
MAVFSYTAIDSDGKERAGTIDAVNVDLAIGALQRRSLIVSRIDATEATGSIFSGSMVLFDHVKNEDVVMMSRQMTTLFEAQVSALRAFRLLASEARTPLMTKHLNAVADDIQAGSQMSAAMAKHPDVFSTFYVNMVRAGEESGKLDETFAFLASYLERNYEITQKARNALIYPAFIVFTFIVVMILMMTLVVPNLAVMLEGLNQTLPLPTRIVIGISYYLRHYLIVLIILVVAAGAGLYQAGQSKNGRDMLSRARLQIPGIGGIYKKIFLSRIADNLSTMLKSGIQILRALEITGAVVGDPVFEEVMTAVALDVKGGAPLSESLRKHPEIPGMIVAMIKIGEETGNVGKILETVANYYRREVDNAVDTMVDLIEPIMIVSLALGVGVLLTAVLMPIYNVASSF